MTFDLISGLHMQIQTWHPPLWLCTHAKYYVKSGLTNVLKNANKTKNMHLFSIRIANYPLDDAKYQISRLLALWFQTRTFFSQFPYISLCKHVTPLGYNLNKLGRSLLGDATDQISRLRPCDFRQEDYSRSPLISLCKTCDPWGWAIFDPRALI